MERLGLILHAIQPDFVHQLRQELYRRGCRWAILRGCPGEQLIEEVFADQDTALRHLPCDLYEQGDVDRTLGTGARRFSAFGLPERWVVRLSDLSDQLLVGLFCSAVPGLLRAHPSPATRLSGRTNGQSSHQPLAGVPA